MNFAPLNAKWGATGLNLPQKVEGQAWLSGVGSGFTGRSPSRSRVSTSLPHRRSRLVSVSIISRRASVHVAVVVLVVAEVVVVAVLVVVATVAVVAVAVVVVTAVEGLWKKPVAIRF